MPATGKGRSRRFAEFNEKPVKDFDIENEVPDTDGESGSEESGDDLAGTEHYVAVGKSKLRQKETISLGPEYRGARVSREALEESSEEGEDEEDEDEDEDEDDSEEDEERDEEFDDPETADLEADHVDDDAEIDSDNALCESDEERLKDFTFPASSKPRVPNGRIAKRPTAADFMSSEDEGAAESDQEAHAEEDETDGSDEGSDEGSEEGSEFDQDGARLSDEEDEEDKTDESSEDDEDEDDDVDENETEDGVDKEEEDEDQKSDGDDDDDRAKLRKMATEGHKSIVAAMSQAAKADADKGAAVRVQRRAFDSILNLRIRLQKALVAANTFSVVDDSHETGMEAYQAAEEAAVKLWNTIDSVRNTFMPESSRAKIGEKRKREIDLDTPSQTVWESMEMVEQVALPHRRKVLDKWSDKVRRNTAAPSTRNLVKTETQSLVSTLDSQLVSSERLIKRARAPRSCAPAQAARKVEEDTEIYDDADFYQLLLKELVDQRSSDTGAPGESVATVRWAALKEAKTRKHVDRKASKGRKLRYTVHEKLQNFMAPEDRRSWEEHAIDRLFGTLFGQKMELKEDEDVSDEEMGGVNVEEAGLRLFQS
ncbi:Protein bfr2 [Madurella mycetomatis]|uniref:Protein BFR2 n=1 Tax=Madurella mycetomatis TaxID=100816 RepID=A0A175VX61_9PEZI|nr:Protein bfr2 [Madurella mycetomatis]